MKTKKMRGWTIKEVEQELARLEPKDLVDYIFKGSAMNQFLNKYVKKKYK